ncbi:unnamed protein product [Victoria cruziana]
MEGGTGDATASAAELYFVFMDFDPEYERLRSNRSKEGDNELDAYLSKKHDMLLERVLGPGTYTKRFSWVIVDGFGVEITLEQASRLRSTEGVRVVEKNLEFI